MSDRNELSIVLLILILSLGLRLFRFDQFPVAGSTQDEYAWTWLGNSLLSGQPPTSWSWFPHYEHSYAVTLNRAEFRIVWPVFDNPPLFSLIPGLMTKIANVNGIQLISIRLIRLPMILLGTINVGLLYLATKLWFDKKTAFLSAFLYGILPIFVFGSRLVISENLLTTWVLLSMIVLQIFLQTKKRKWLYVLGIVAGLGVLTKMSGLLIVVAVGGILWAKKMKKEVGILFIPFLLTVSLWLVYAAIYGWQTFWATQLAQSMLQVSWVSIVNLFMRLHLTEEPYLSGWFLLGQILLFIFPFIPLGDKKKFSPLPYYVLAWLGFYLLTTDQTVFRGWYRYPMFPLMAIVLAQLIQMAYQSTLVLVPLLFLGLLPMLRYVFLFLEIPTNNLMVRIGILIIGIISVSDLFITLTNKQRAWLVRLLLFSVFVCSILMLKNVTGDAIYADNQLVFPDRWK